MITLHGLTLSNYYNKAKMALLEKGVPFTENKVATHSQAASEISVMASLLLTCSW